MSHAPAAVVAAAARRLAALEGMPLAGLRIASIAPAPTAPECTDLGTLYESLLAPATRRREGAHYTAPAVAAGVVSMALARVDPNAAPRVCDPAVGGGAFLLAAARQLEAMGVPRSRIVADHLYGMDADPLAVAVAEFSLARWAWRDGTAPPPSAHLVVADALLDRPFAQVDVQLVVGNPPFLSQLASATARSRTRAERVKQRYGPAAVRYTDTALLFLLAGLDLVGDRGVVALLQPLSMLASADAATARHGLLERSVLTDLWVARDQVFAANVHVCAPVLVKGTGTQGVVARWRGSDFAPARPAPLAQRSTWAPLAGDLLGIPEVAIEPHGTLGDLGTATAGFRDQFYGLAPHVVEGAEPRLVTAGAIDPLRINDRSVRFARRVWRRPGVVLDGVAATSASLADWVRARCTPKVLVATQTRVIEAVVDADGDLVPSTPVVAVHAPPERLWHVAAALSAPPVSAWAMHRYGGAALSPDALKLSAKQVLEVPLPPNQRAWDRGAAAARAAATATTATAWRTQLRTLGSHMCAAYDAADGVLEWWTARLPPWR